MERRCRIDGTEDCHGVRAAGCAGVRRGGPRAVAAPAGGRSRRAFRDDLPPEPVRQGPPLAPQPLAGRRVPPLGAGRRRKRRSCAGVRPGTGACCRPGPPAARGTPPAPTRRPTAHAAPPHPPGPSVRAGPRPRRWGWRSGRGWRRCSGSAAGATSASPGCSAWWCSRATRCGRSPRPVAGGGDVREVIAQIQQVERALQRPPGPRPDPASCRDDQRRLTARTDATPGRRLA